MTVAKLIAELQKLDPKLRVRFADEEDCAGSPVFTVRKVVTAKSVEAQGVDADTLREWGLRRGDVLLLGVTR